MLFRTSRPFPCSRASVRLGHPTPHSPPHPAGALAHIKPNPHKPRQPRPPRGGGPFILFLSWNADRLLHPHPPPAAAIYDQSGTATVPGRTSERVCIVTHV